MAQELWQIRDPVDLCVLFSFHAARKKKLFQEGGTKGGTNKVV